MALGSATHQVPLVAQGTESPGWPEVSSIAVHSSSVKAPRPRLAHPEYLSLPMSILCQHRSFFFFFNFLFF